MYVTVIYDVLSLGLEGFCLALFCYMLIVLIGFSSKVHVDSLS